MKTSVTLLLFFTLLSPDTFAQDYTQLSLPEGATARLGKGWVIEVRYSPDGTRLAVTGSIGIWLYDTATHREVALLTGHKGPVNSVAFSPDGRTLATGSADHTMRLWDAVSSAQTRNLTGCTVRPGPAVTGEQKRTPTKQIEVFDALLSAVKSGRISQTRLDQSVERILKSKGTMFGRRFADVEAVGRTVGGEAHKQIAQTIASRAITVVRNRNNLLPLKLEPETSVLILSESPILFDSFKGHHLNTTGAIIPEKPEAARILPHLIQRAENADVIIAGITNNEQAALVQQLRLGTTTPVIVIALGSPYTLRGCPAVSASLAAYDIHDASVSAAVEVIVGAREAQGKLPIQLPIED